MQEKEIKKSISANIFRTTIYYTLNPYNFLKSQDVDKIVLWLWCVSLKYLVSVYSGHSGKCVPDLSRWDTQAA